MQATLQGTQNSTIIVDAEISPEQKILNQMNDLVVGYYAKNNNPETCIQYYKDLNRCANDLIQMGFKIELNDDGFCLV